MNYIKSISFAGFILLLTSCASTKPKLSNIDEIMVKQDINKDGKISVAEAKGYIAKNFAWIDENRNQFINMVELRRAVSLTSSRATNRNIRGVRPAGPRQGFGAPRPGNIDGGINRRGRF